MLGRIPQQFFGRGLLQLDFNWRILHHLIFSKVSRIAACLGFVDLCDYTHCLPNVCNILPDHRFPGSDLVRKMKLLVEKQLWSCFSLAFPWFYKHWNMKSPWPTRSFHIHMLSPAPDVLPLRPFVSASQAKSDIEGVCKIPGPWLKVGVSSLSSSHEVQPHCCNSYWSAC